MCRRRRIVFKESMEKKKKVWFWGEKDGESGGGGGGRAKEAEDDVAEHLSRDGTMSQYSLSKGLLPSLGATSRSSRDVNLRRFIISPFDPRYRSVLFPRLSISISISNFGTFR